MPANVQSEGTYELFETTKKHRVLVLNGEEWFAWVEGQRGELLVRSDADHEKQRTLQQGRFYLVDFEDAPDYRDMPHLFLEREGRFQEVMLPNGLPTEEDDRKKVVGTDNMLDREALEGYLQHPNSAEGDAQKDGSSDGSAADAAQYLQDLDFPARKREALRQARQKDAPRAVVDRLRQIEARTYTSMEDLTGALS